jgi:hypothetical protein
MSTRLSLVLAAAFLTAAPAQASTYVSVFNFSWTGTWSYTGDGSPNSDGLWGITASSEFINPYPDDSIRFDPANGAYRVEGRVDIVGDLGSSFTGANVIGLTLDVISTDDYRIRSYSIARDDLRLGIMSGSIVEDSLGNRSAELSAFRLMQRVDPNDPTQKFEEIFGCPTILEGCGTGFFQTPFPAFESGNPVPPSGLGSQYGVVLLTDGRSDPCCGARSNALRFYYETPEQALASFRLTWDRDKSYTLEGPVPEGLPSPIPLPAGLPLLLGALGLLGLTRMRRRGAPPSQD